MLCIIYPKGDPRRHDAIIPHRTPIQVLQTTANLTFVRWNGSVWPVSPDYVKDKKKAHEDGED